MDKVSSYLSLVGRWEVFCRISQGARRLARTPRSSKKIIKEKASEELLYPSSRPPYLLILCKLCIYLKKFIQYVQLIKLEPSNSKGLKFRNQILPIPFPSLCIIILGLSHIHYHKRSNHCSCILYHSLKILDVHLLSE